MDRKAFELLLKKYLDNSCTEEEKRLLDQWYDLLHKEHEPLSQDERELVEERLWNKIQAANEPPQLQTRKKIHWWKYAAAACVVGVIILGLLWITTPQPAAADSVATAKAKEGFLEVLNNTSNVKAVQLEDGSSVTMYPGSKLVYPRHFEAGKREVQLEGNAFFSVSRHPNRPFFVYNNQLVTQVLGTSFEIRSKGEQVEVAVKTGRVAVYENKEQLELNDAQQRSNGVIITPNQKVIYYKQERHFVSAIVDHPVPVAKELKKGSSQPGFKYNETPLIKVLEDLEDAYELEIVLESDKIANCLFTGDLTEENLFDKLEAICIIFNASYEIKGTTILLKATKECTPH